MKGGLSVLLLILLTACGQKGPLYLPEAQPAQNQAPVSHQPPREEEDGKSESASSLPQTGSIDP